MEILPALTSLSPEGKSDEAYNHQICDHIAYLKQLLTSKNSSVISNSDTILDVSQILILHSFELLGS